MIMAVPWSLLFIGLIACLELASGQPKTLYFSFVTAHSDQYTALGAIPAVDLALQRINSDSTILPGYLLNYTTDVGNSMVSCSTCLVYEGEMDHRAGTRPRANYSWKRNLVLE